LRHLTGVFPKFSTHSGIFGLVAPRYWLGDLVAGPLSSILGNVGYVAALKYFEPLVMSTVMLVAQIIGCFFVRITFRAAPMPEPVTWLGTCIALLGICSIVLAGRVSITHFNIHLRSSGGAS
jgi:drug/metabolite transporter (DMT)-like permease